ncbi:3-mercaptopyruvate sulfurtransferase [Roseibium salinum]|uniref:3-mercaptopyruvate sulfurtransferase n=1 Tax=Roseibium salinum TaxID=1604349 RepID=A0ABT3R1B0_9HYPH|nr:3-mercaptopyruvate sulfurtransferase [Roseibium sp. DSM 29163]MCX2722885.1 3-mercaptopyruvate sulfurtransferase [Roseibium sp. DSM 29163]MDN3719187.1 3-mercaptopyruvate sulfurtransferase [Roseibium salinum]
MTDHPLVSTQWLADHLASPDLVVINAWMPPVNTPDLRPVYPDAHIPGAVFFDVNEVCDKSSDLPHMLPAPHVFSSAMRKLGVGDGQTLVVYDDFGFYSAPRVWWTLRSMGATRVHVLDGGFPKWQAEDRPVADTETRRVQSHFSSRLNHSAVADIGDIQNAVSTGTRQIVDARSAGRFEGTAAEPRAGLRSGHIPGSLNLPFTKLIRDDGTFRSKEELAAAFRDAGVDPDKPVTTTCGSGVTAAILTLALTIIGSRDLALYDGSWAEWGSREDTDVATGPS